MSLCIYIVHYIWKASLIKAENNICLQVISHNSLFRPVKSMLSGFNLSLWAYFQLVFRMNKSLIRLICTTFPLLMCCPIFWNVIPPFFNIPTYLDIIFSSNVQFTSYILNRYFLLTSTCNKLLFLYFCNIICFITSIFLSFLCLSPFIFLLPRSNYFVYIF